MTSVQPGEVQQIAPGVRCLVANNGGMMTGPGTNTYLLGEKEVGVIDPGPLDEVHMHRILDAGNDHIRWIFATHTHRDHSPGVAPLAEKTGATVVGLPGSKDSWNDATFVPEILPEDGQRITTSEWTLEAVLTPGHASNHICYLLPELKLLFTGDHIMNGSTVVIAPPDGDMAAYLASLRKIKTDAIERIAPGHGAPLDRAHDVIDWIIQHRLERESLVRQAVAKLEAESSSLDDLVAVVYDGLDRRLISMAKRSLEAHLLKLEAEKQVSRHGEHWRTRTS